MQLCLKKTCIANMLNSTGDYGWKEEKKVVMKPSRKYKGTKMALGEWNGSGLVER